MKLFLRIAIITSLLISLSPLTALAETAETPSCAGTYNFSGYAYGTYSTKSPDSQRGGPLEDKPYLKGVLKIETEYLNGKEIITSIYADLTCEVIFKGIKYVKKFTSNSFERTNIFVPLEQPYNKSAQVWTEEGPYYGLSIHGYDPDYNTLQVRCSYGYELADNSTILFSAELNHYLDPQKKPSNSDSGGGGCNSGFALLGLSLILGLNFIVKRK